MSERTDRIMSDPCVAKHMPLLLSSLARLFPELPSGSREISALVCLGLTNKEVGILLNLSEQKVTSKLASIYKMIGHSGRHNLSTVFHKRIADY